MTNECAVTKSANYAGNIRRTNVTSDIITPTLHPCKPELGNLDSLLKFHGDHFMEDSSVSLINYNRQIDLPF